MSAGKLSERIRIDTEARVSDNGGGASLSWTQGPTRWAKVEPLKGQEQLHAMQLQASTLYKITMRNDGTAITAANRLVWLTGGNLVLNIREAPHTPIHSLMRVIIAEAGVAV